ncbi:MAG: ABC transporter substrate-binding protein, partial [Anaerolineaceae bacterium]|nr:ABC transporter substrate-binding protein [Anaerolineaceae bacterium]
MQTNQTKRTAFILIIIVISSVFILTACQKETVNEEPEIITTPLTLGYIPNIQFAPIYVAAEKGYFLDAGFDVSIEYGNESDAVALIGAGEQLFAIASGEQVLLARAQGLPVTYVAAWYQKYPVGIVSLSGSDILVPENLAGKSIGVPGLYGASYIGLRALLSAADLGEEDVDLLSIGYNQVEYLVTEQVDSAVIYLANEPVVLQSQGYDADVIRAADYLRLVANGLVTNETMLNEHPEQVKAFIEALLKGVADTLADPDEAYEISMSYVEDLADFDRDLQFEILNQSILLWETETLGYSEPAGWVNMQAV